MAQRGVTVELVKEAIIQEQPLNTLTPAIGVWVKERKPKTALEAGQLADDYMEARKQTIRMTNQGALRRRCTVLISVVATLHFREWVWWKEER